jgi:hypothetical protein
VDFQAPVEEILDAAASEPAAECEPAPAAAVTSLSPAQAATATPAAPRRQRSYLPPRLRRVVRRTARWTHTPVALWIGSCVTAALAALVVGGVVLVGVRGVSAPNTHYYYPQATDLGSSIDDSLIFPRPQPVVGPPSIELGIPGTITGVPSTTPRVSYDQLEHAVLQDYDLDNVFSLEGAAPVGEDPRNGLIAVFNASFQRGMSAIDPSTTEFPGLKAVFSNVAVYTDATTASAQMDSLNVDQLGLSAGLPDMTATPLSIAQIADESRAVRLLGTAGGDVVEVVLIQFRINGAVGVVGAAAALGDDPDLLTQAVALAQTQQRNMLDLTLAQQ